MKMRVVQRFEYDSREKTPRTSIVKTNSRYDKKQMVREAHYSQANVSG